MLRSDASPSFALAKAPQLSQNEGFNDLSLSLGWIAFMALCGIPYKAALIPTLCRNVWLMKRQHVAVAMAF